MILLLWAAAGEKGNAQIERGMGRRAAGHAGAPDGFQGSRGDLFPVRQSMGFVVAD